MDCLHPSTAPNAARRSSQNAFILVAAARSGSLVCCTATALFLTPFLRKPSCTDVPSGHVMRMYFRGVAERTASATSGSHCARVRALLQARYSLPRGAAHVVL